MRSFFWLAVVLSCFSMGLGCAPRVRVKSNPGPHDQGIRYYRPKPYLLISNIAERVPNENGKPGRAVLDERYVDIQLQYLPDFEEEYAIDVRTGFGVADVAITLEDGWNLTAINQKLDSQTDENLKAAADLMGSVGSRQDGIASVSGQGDECSFGVLRIGYRARRLRPQAALWVPVRRFYSVPIVPDVDEWKRMRQLPEHRDLWLGVRK